MIARAFSTPRPVPRRVAPILAGAAVVALALPVFLVARWPLAGWALGAVLWLVAQALGLLLTRLPLSADRLAAAAVVGISMLFRPVAVIVVAVAVAIEHPALGIAAALLYALAYTLELAVSLVAYFGSPGR